MCHPSSHLSTTLPLMDTIPVRSWPTAVDLFCGCGGVTEGLKKSHFRVVAAVDNDPVACQTYRLNHPRVQLLAQDVNDVDVAQIRREQLGGRDLDLLVVCAPCQPFSRQNRQKSRDQRADLILASTRFARVLRPRLIFFENVPGLTGERFSAILEKLHSNLRMCGYTLTEPHDIDAADYGVPQRRHRCVMLARRKAEPPALPLALTPPGNRVTVRTAFSGLRRLQSGEAHPRDTLHFSRNHLPIAIERLQCIPKDGGSRSALPKRLRLSCHVDNRAYSDVYGRMAWSDVAPTLTTGCTDVTRGRFAHPEDNRAITLREAARLQTFPDAYRFWGNASQIATQIGNAVPVRLIEALAPMLRSAIRL